MAALNYPELQALWVANGGTAGWAPLMAAVAIAQSGGTPTKAWNTTEHRTAMRPTAGYEGATGLWQIEWPEHQQLQQQVTGTSTRAALYTPNVNAKVAIALWGNSAGWTNWTTTTSHTLNIQTWRQHGSPARPSASTLGSWHDISQGTAGGVTGTGVFTIASAIQNEGTNIVNRLLKGLHLPGHLTTTVTGTGGGGGGTASKAAAGRTPVSSLLSAPSPGKGTGLTFLDVLLSPGSAGEFLVRTMEVVAGSALALLALAAVVLALVGSSLRPKDLVAGLVPGGAVLAGVFGKGASK